MMEGFCPFPPPPRSLFAHGDKIIEDFSSIMRIIYTEKFKSHRLPSIFVIQTPFDTLPSSSFFKRVNQIIRMKRYTSIESLVSSPKACNANFHTVSARTMKIHETHGGFLSGWWNSAHVLSVISNGIETRAEINETEAESGWRERERSAFFPGKHRK